MTSPDEEVVPVAIVTVARAMVDGEIRDYVNAEDNAGDTLDLSTALGMLRLAEHAIVHGWADADR